MTVGGGEGTKTRRVKDLLIKPRNRVRGTSRGSPARGRPAEGEMREQSGPLTTEHLPKPISEEQGRWSRRGSFRITRYGRAGNGKREDIGHEGI